jgi:hypothetical protein
MTSRAVLVSLRGTAVRAAPIAPRAQQRRYATEEKEADGEVSSEDAVQEAIKKVSPLGCAVLLPGEPVAVRLTRDLAAS